MNGELSQTLEKRNYLSLVGWVDWGAMSLNLNITFNLNITSNGEFRRGNLFNFSICASADKTEKNGETCTSNENFRSWHS